MSDKAAVVLGIVGITAGVVVLVLVLRTWAEISAQRNAALAAALQAQAQANKAGAQWGGIAAVTKYGLSGAAKILDIVI